MAALIRHGSSTISFLKCASSVFASNTNIARPGDVPVRFNTKKNRVIKRAKKAIKPEVANRINATEESLSSSGFVRSYKPYDPPKNVNERIEEICARLKISASDDTKLEDPVERFKIFVACEKAFLHKVPNSQIYLVETVGHLKEFYGIPVETLTPYESLQKIELPENLYIRNEYHRFHPDTDTMFGGNTAFPMSSTIVTGLKYIKKYKGHSQGDPFYDAYMKMK